MYANYQVNWVESGGGQDFAMLHVHPISFTLERLHVVHVEHVLQSRRAITLQ